MVNPIHTDIKIKDVQKVTVLILSLFVRKLNNMTPPSKIKTHKIIRS
jgi:hypothetical protein